MAWQRIKDEEGQEIVWPYYTPWSYSALNKFEECPKNYGDTNVFKKYPFTQSPAMKAGEVVHKQLEDYVTSGAELPIMLQKIGRMIDALCKGAVEVIPERAVNLTHELQPCGVFDDWCSYRGKLDLTIVRKDALVIIDYKTSSEPRETFEQLEFNAMAALFERPHIPVVHALFVYTRHPHRQMAPYRWADAIATAKNVIPRLQRLKDARTKKDFPARPGSSCRWCPVIDCTFNPKYGK